MFPSIFAPGRLGALLRRCIRAAVTVSGIGRLFNSGSPMSRRRTERIRSSFLDGLTGGFQWQKCIVVGLSFPDDICPVEFTERALEQAGFISSDEAVWSCDDLPDGPLHCRETELSPAERGEILQLTDDDFLRFALILGLSGRTHYDVSRPVIWTEARLRRTIALYRPRGFYDD
jgi:hypothetical protein